MTDNEEEQWLIYEAHLETWRANGRRGPRPMRPLQHGSHIDSLPREEKRAPVKRYHALVEP